jgi:hypothetical protein
MGFFDCRCMATGVSLKGTDAALVLLQQADGVHRPIALAITGAYDRLGAIDNIDEDDNTELVRAYFLDKLRSGEFVVDEEYLPADGDEPAEALERLLRGFERNINDSDTTALLHCRPVVFALLCRIVFDAIAKSGAPAGSHTALFRNVFKDVPVAEELYRGSLTKVFRQLRALSAVSDFLATRRIAWKPPDDPSQHYSDEMREYLSEARRTFRDSEVVLGALKAYQREVGDLLDDD